MIVVDTNVLLYLSIAGDKTALAQLVRVRDGAWAVPPLWRHEYLNALATYGKAGRIPWPELSRLWSRALAAFSPLERTVDYLEALRLALDRSISAYDAQYLALATALDATLVTEDKALVKKAGGRAVDMAQFCR